MLTIDPSANEITRDARSVMDSIPGLLALLAPNGDILFVNRRILEYTGRTLEELKQWSTGDTIHPDDLPDVTRVFTQSVASGTPYEIVQRLRRSDGVYRWFQHSGFPRRDDTGCIARWYALLADIDERTRAEALLAGEKRLLEMVASGSPLPTVLEALCKLVEENATNCHCGIYLIDQTDHVFRGYASPSLPASYNDPIMGFPVGPEIGPCGTAAHLKRQVIAADIDTDPRWQTSAFRRAALAHGLKSAWSTPIVSLTGDVLGTFAVYQREVATATPLQLELIGRATHLASIAIERTQRETERKRADEELRRAYDHLTEAQRLSQTGSFTADLERDEHFWSDEFYRICEFEPGSPVSLNRLGEIVHPEDAALYEGAISHAMAGTDPDLYFRIVTSRGVVKHLRGFAHRIADRPVFVGAVQDVTASKRAQEALNKAGAELAHVSRMTTLSALTASIAHEVNQPLAGIITNAGTCLRMLDAVPPNIGGARETARRTIRDGNRASDVITRLRALFSRKDFPAEPLDLNDAAREVIALSANDLQRHRVILRAELAEGLPFVSGDRIQLQQVIFNLMRNATDAMAEVHDRLRHLLVRTDLDDEDRVRLTVRDVGVGLPPGSAHSLFDAFYSTKNGGMGIGLFVSRSIIERHQGRLWAEPNDDGPGATFAFSIRRDAPDPERTVPA